jgi:hypothetical protein
MKRALLLFLFSVVGNCVMAQDSLNTIKPKFSVPVEVLTGNNRLYFQLLIKKDFALNNKLGFFNLSSFAADYQNDISKNDALTSSALYYHIYKGFSINSGVAFSSSSGLKPFIGLQYIYAKPTFLLIYLPSFFYTNDNKVSNLAIVEYRPKIKGKWLAYSRIQGNFTFNTDENNHSRSYVYGRLGLTYSNFTFGVGSNLDWYGSMKKFRENYGIFFKINL